MHHIHYVPGRLRIRIPALKRNPEQAAKLSTRLRQAPGIHHVQANELTGSLLVHYDPAACSRTAILRQLPRASRRGPNQPSPHPSTASRLVVNDATADRLSRMVLETVVELAMDRSARALLTALI